MRLLDGLFLTGGLLFDAEVEEGGGLDGLFFREAVQGGDGASMGVLLGLVFGEVGFEEGIGGMLVSWLARGCWTDGGFGLSASIGLGFGEV